MDTREQQGLTVDHAARIEITVVPTGDVFNRFVLSIQQNRLYINVPVDRPTLRQFVNAIREGMINDVELDLKTRPTTPGRTLKVFDIWAGYSVTGEDPNKTMRAHWLGVSIGTSFADACDNYFTNEEEFYDSEEMTYWGCRLYGFDKDADKLRTLQRPDEARLVNDKK